jgi:hypothetical protein
MSPPVLGLKNIYTKKLFFLTQSLLPQTQQVLVSRRAMMLGMEIRTSFTQAKKKFTLFLG